MGTKVKVLSPITLGKKGSQVMKFKDEIIDVDDKELLEELLENKLVEKVKSGSKEVSEPSDKELSIREKSKKLKELKKALKEAGTKEAKTQIENEIKALEKEQKK